MGRQQRSWTDEDLRAAVASSLSFAEVLRRLGLADGSRRYIQQCIVKLGIDASHIATGPRRKLFTDDELRGLVANARSATEILQRLGHAIHTNHFFLLRRHIEEIGLDTSHFGHARGRHGPRGRWNDDQLRAAVRESFSYADVIRRVGLVPAGGNYVQVQRRIRELALDVSHFHPPGHYLKGVKPRPPRPLEELLVSDIEVTSHEFKWRLIRAGLKQPACELCGWAHRREIDGAIPIELDHVNGNRRDNRLENLRILCPNCHALQPMHRGLNQKRRRS